MKTKLILLFLFSAVSCYQPLVAQKRDVKGKVTTFGEIPLNKVLITGKNLNTEYFSDENGNFSLVCDEDEKLSFEAHGFTSKKIKVSNFSEGDSVKVDLQYKNGEKYFEVATGYGHINEKQLNYAISHLEAGPDYSAYRTIFEAIEGRVSGVSVGSSSVNIRGTTVMGGYVPALLVVDGTIVEFTVFSNIPPSQVKSIDVLKGAAASARYGTRGMGGVIVVKTKSGN